MKLGQIPVDDGYEMFIISHSGKYKLRARPNGRREPGVSWMVSIDNLKDPNRSEYDYFTTYYPSTLKAAVGYMEYV